MPPSGHHNKASQPRKTTSSAPCKCYPETPKKPSGKPATPSGPCSASKLQKCTVRGCGFSSMHGGLRRHMLTHTGEKKHRCKFIGCGFRSAYPHALKHHIVRHNTSEPHICVERYCKFKSASLRDLSVHRHEVHRIVKKEVGSPSRILAAHGPEQSTARPQSDETRRRRGKEGEHRGREKDNTNNEHGPKPNGVRPQAAARSAKQSADTTRPLKRKFLCRQDASGRTTGCDHWDCAFRAGKEQEVAQGARLGRAEESPTPDPTQITTQSDGRLKKRKRDDATTDSDAFLPSESSTSDSDGESDEPRRNRKRLEAPPAGEDEQEDIEEDEMDMLRNTRYSQTLDTLPEVRLPSPVKRLAPRERSVKEEELEDPDELDTLSQAGSSTRSVEGLHEAMARQEKMMCRIHHGVKKLRTQGVRVEVAWGDAQPFVREEMRALAKKFQDAISKAFEE